MIVSYIELVDMVRRAYESDIRRIQVVTIERLPSGEYVLNGLAVGRAMIFVRRWVIDPKTREIAEF